MAALITAPRLMAIGGGALAELPGLLARLGLARPLIVTDPYIAGCGILERATALFDGAGVPWSVFSDTVPDPTTEAIAAGVARLASGDFDSLVAIGGGSSIDTAKGMSVLFANGGQMRDYKVPNDIPRAGLPIIAVPTTAGTGSEVTRFTVVSDTETDEKMLIAGRLRQALRRLARQGRDRMPAACRAVRRMHRQGAVPAGDRRPQDLPGAHRRRRNPGQIKYLMQSTPGIRDATG